MIAPGGKPVHQLLNGGAEFTVRSRAELIGDALCLCQGAFSQPPISTDQVNVSLLAEEFPIFNRYGRDEWFAHREQGAGRLEVTLLRSNQRQEPAKSARG